MTDRPILFSTPMVRALLAGTKTQTRRIIKPRGRKFESLFNGQWTDDYVLDPGNESWRQRDIPIKLGDRLWVREAWRTLQQWDDLKPSYLGDDIGKITFEADPENRNKLWAFGKLRPSMFMPRWASRLTLAVTDVRVERLQDISELDALAEGVVRSKEPFEYDEGHGTFSREQDWFSVPGIPDPGCGTSATDMFSVLWEYVNGAGAWDANPWVVAYTFEVHHTNIDQMAKEAA